ncbi:MAG: RelA/SpoT domain-containing protein [Desulfobacterales bacterium]|nr:RelA/SpoT domain-containing protein [Desulfobacterales bacterium]
MTEIHIVEDLREYIESKIHLFKIFLKGVESVFREDPVLNGVPPVIHSIKTRIKANDRIEDKINRKSDEADPITKKNVFERITDFAGIRVMHLYQQQFTKIHECINEQLSRRDWVLFENPKAYTWDPESKEFFESYNLEVQLKESFYTSIHYVVKPRKDSEVTCEIQVRTLFEEIWGEIDHTINYPHSTTSLSCQEQLRVLARLVGAGSRLADSIFRVNEEEMRKDQTK